MTTDIFAPRPVDAPELHARWIRALVISGLSNSEVRQHLLCDNLPAPSEAELNAVRSAWTPPPGFLPNSGSHVESIRFLCQAQCYPFFLAEDRAARDALRILRAARPREMIEAALIIGVPRGVVVDMVKSLLKFETSERAIELYGLACFDVGGVSRSELHVLVRERVQLSAARAAGVNVDEAAMRRAVMSDARMLAVTLPSSSVAWHSVLLSLGWIPPKTELGKLVDELEAVAGVRAAQALLRGGRDDERRAESFVGVLGKLRDIRESIVAPQETVVQALSRVRIQQDWAPPMSVAELVARGDTVGTLDAAADDVGQGEEVEREKKFA